MEVGACHGSDIRNGNLCAGFLMQIYRMDHNATFRRGVFQLRGMASSLGTSIASLAQVSLKASDTALT